MMKHRTETVRVRWVLCELIPNQTRAQRNQPVFKFGRNRKIGRRIASRRKAGRHRMTARKRTSTRWIVRSGVGARGEVVDGEYVPDVVEVILKDGHRQDIRDPVVFKSFHDPQPFAFHVNTRCCSFQHEPPQVRKRWVDNEGRCGNYDPALGLSRCDSSVEVTLRFS